jgi:hypothetical protein
MCTARPCGMPVSPAISSAKGCARQAGTEVFVEVAEAGPSARRLLSVRVASSPIPEPERAELADRGQAGRAQSRTVAAYGLS